MKRKKIIVLVAFVLLALVQLFIPAKMILDKEDIIKLGNVYKIKTRPIDPTDPFRGKYVTLGFPTRRFAVEKGTEWSKGEDAYIALETDENGFTVMKSASKEKPTDSEDYLKAKVKYAYEDMLTVEYPFNRYYMEESKAYDAERLYNKVRRDTTKVTYALVHVKEGEAVLTDVLINEVSIREIVKNNQLKRKNR